MRRQQQLHDPEPCFGAHGREHVGISSDLPGIRFC
jgi:hypothetical protein